MYSITHCSKFSLEKELSGISTVVQTLVKESSENKRVIQMMARDIKDLRTSVEDVGNQVTSLRGEVVEIGDKVQQLMTLKQIVKVRCDQLRLHFLNESCLSGPREPVI